MPLHHRVGLSSFALLLVLSWACGSGTSSDDPNGGGGGAGGKGGGGFAAVSGGFDTDSGNAIPQGDAACLDTEQSADPVPIDLLFMVDTTRSMLCHTGKGAPLPCPSGVNGEIPDASGPTRFDAEVAGISAFAKDPANATIGAGLTFFPQLGNQLCNARSYETPAVAVDLLSTTGPRIVAELGKRRPEGSTPTLASLRGGITHAKALSAKRPDRKISIVYVTDGVPQGCSMNSDSELAQAAQAAAEGAKANILTFVLGVGPSLENLNEIAKKGGTEKAYLLDVGADVQTQFAEALAKIRKKTIGCEFPFPKGTSGNIDPNFVYVEAGIGNQPRTPLPYLTDASKCQPGGGWYYDDPSNPSRIILCDPPTCAPIRDTPGSSMRIVAGCEARIH